MRLEKINTTQRGLEEDTQSLRGKRTSRQEDAPKRAKRGCPQPRTRVLKPRANNAYTGQRQQPENTRNDAKEGPKETNSAPAHLRSSTATGRRSACTRLTTDQTRSNDNTREERVVGGIFLQF